VIGAGRQLELPACQWPRRPSAPAIARFPGGLIVAQSCLTGVLVSRFGSATRPERTVELKGEVEELAIAVDGFGHLALVTVPAAAEKPALTLLRLDDLTQARAPVRLDPPEQCPWGAGARIAVDPTTPGRFAVLFVQAIGHGSGCATRLDLCGAEERLFVELKRRGLLTQIRGAPSLRRLAPARRWCRRRSAAEPELFVELGVGLSRPDPCRRSSSAFRRPESCTHQAGPACLVVSSPRTSTRCDEPGWSSPRLAARSSVRASPAPSSGPCGLRGAALP